MRKLLGCLVVALLVVGVIVFIVFYWTGDMTRAADRFFVLIRDGNPKEAYKSTTREFQAQTSEENFLTFLKNSTIGDYESASWTSRSVSGNTGDLEGSIKTRGGGVLPIKVKLVKEMGEWRIHALEKAPAGLVSNVATPGIPAENELVAMTNASIMLLARAVNSNDFSDLYKSIAQVWQSQITAEALRDAFKTLIDSKVDLTVIEGKTPDFTEKPVIDDSGRLILKGRYATQPSRIAFTLKFVNEGSLWKLLGISVSAEEASDTSASTVSNVAIPPDDELAGMSNRSMMLLAEAISRDDFSDLYNSISKLWQGQTSKEKLRDQFRVFVEKKISLTLIDGTAPVFTEKPVVDDKGVLAVTGHYPTKPYRIDFRLKFIDEESQWRLVGINVSTAGQ